MNSPQQSKRSRSIAIDLILGVAIGAAVGVTSEQMGVWMAGGAGVGVALGAAFGSR